MPKGQRCQELALLAFESASQFRWLAKYFDTSIGQPLAHQQPTPEHDGFEIEKYVVEPCSLPIEPLNRAVTAGEVPEAQLAHCPDPSSVGDDEGLGEHLCA